MKLSPVVLATVANCAPERNNERLHHPWHAQWHADPPVACSTAPSQTEGIGGGSPFSSEGDDQSGQVTFDAYVSAANCYVDIGPNCPDGVEAEISYMAVENAFFMTQEFDYIYWGCQDSINFTWLSKDGTTQEATDPQCGCLGDENHPTCNHPGFANDYFMEYRGLRQTQKPTKYNFNGTDVKLVLKSDLMNEGGKIQIDWKCWSPPTTSPPPSTGATIVINTLEMANAVLTGDFTVEMAADYGCSGRGLFDPFAPTIGSHVDSTDAALFKWKKCVQCATGNSSTILPYSYDVESDTCGKYKTKG